MPEGATDKTTATAKPDLKSRLEALRDRCAALREREPTAKAAPVAWPRDLNASSSDGSWGDDPAEVRG